jgi:diaminopimelate epimerase
MKDYSLISGSGNTFTVSDNRDGHIADIITYTKKHSAENKTDGSLFIEPSAKADFRMRIINADGSEAEMCGNGARCAALFAYDRRIVESRLMTFETLAGIIQGEVKENGLVKVQLTDPTGYKTGIKVKEAHYEGELSFINTGVPHAILLTDDVEKMDVFTIGREIRRSAVFAPAGTNVNFVQVLDRNTIKVRTYERGVENETGACGTGSTASSLVVSALGLADSPIQVLTRSGEILTVTFHRKENQFRQVFLEGIVKYL